MAKKLKESQPFSIRMEKTTFDRLEQFCKASGQTKTTAVERALEMYIDDYEEKRRKLQEKPQ